MTGSVGHASALPQRSPAPVGVDATISSTTPDVPERRETLSAPASLGWGLGIGAGLGALLLRGSGAGWGLGALGGGAWKGALVGAGMGAALLGLDRLTGGQVKQQLDFVSLDRRHQVLFVLQHPTDPWIAGTGLGVARDAKSAQDRLYGAWDPKDGPQDAFRHAYAAALFSLRAMRDHGEAASTARVLAIGAGDAHEADGQDNNDDHSRSMDAANNRTGAGLVGDGRALPGEDADADGFVTEHALRGRVLAAMSAGRLQVVDRSLQQAAPRPTSARDMPGVAGPSSSGR